MICPKCQGSMRTVDKQGVHLEQCDTCRGIFLDHGELEQIQHAEQRYYGGATTPYVGPHGHSDSPRHYSHHRDSPRPHHGGGHYSDSPRPYGHQRHGRGSFLKDLFG